MTGSVSRRRLLLTLAGAILAGCGTRSPGRQASTGPSSAPVARGRSTTVSTPLNSGAAPITLGARFAFLVPAGVFSAYERTNPKVRFATTPAAAPPRYSLGTPFTSYDLGGWADLTEALHTLNFDPAVLFPGALAGWTYNGRIRALPYAQYPLGVQWRRDVFTKAGMAPPAPNWTYDDFRKTCAQLQAMAASGRFKGLSAAVGPIAMAPRGTLHTQPQSSGVEGSYNGPSTAAGLALFVPALLWSGLWQSFVWGFGGSVARHGRFSLTAPQTVAALQQLVDLAREYSLPGRYISSLSTKTTGAAWEAEIRSMFAMRFAQYDGGGSALPTGWEWTRLPRFPVDPVIPVGSYAVAVGATGAGAPPPPDAPETLAVARFGNWLDSAAGVAVTAPSGLAPALATAAVQRQFWTGPYPRAAASIGDWQHFRSMYDGFPVVPTATSVERAISDAVEGTAPLATALAQPEKDLNAELLYATS